MSPQEGMRALEARGIAYEHGLAAAVYLDPTRDYEEEEEQDELPF